MTARRQLAAYSPVTLASVWRSMRAFVREPHGIRATLGREVRERYGATAALLVGSGTAALQLALAGVKAISSNRPVALPAYSCYDLATAAVGAESDVLLYDVEPATLGPEHGSLQRVLARQPSAVVMAPLFGYPIDVAHLEQRGGSAAPILIEDAAQAAGGNLHGKPLGSFGELTVLSFGRGKGVTAGAGGALLARGAVGERVLQWAAARLGPSPPAGAREAATLAAQWILGRPRLYWLPAAFPFLRLGETVYRPPRHPTAMSRSALAALAVNRHHADAELVRRRAAADRLLRSARHGGRVAPIDTVAGAESGYLRLPLLAAGNAESVVRELGGYGVARGYPTSLVALPPLAERVANAGEAFPGAELLAERLVTFPTHGLLAERDLMALEAWLTGVG